MQSTTALEVVNAAAKVTTRDGTSYILIINQALYDNNKAQKESLLQPHQARAHGVAIDDCATRHRHTDGSPGGQCIQVSDYRIPLLYDGWKCYLSVKKPTEKDLQDLPHIELTSPRPYEPSRRIHTRRRKKKPRQDQDCAKRLEQWRARLGYPTLDVTKHTLKHTTQLVNTVEAETREYMRDHRKARLQPLRPHRINDTCFSDTFFSSIRSVRGFEMFQLFAFKFCKLDVVYPMKKKSQAPMMLADLVRQVGAPNYMVTDDAKEMTSTKWMDICQHACIESHTSEAYHQNSNYAERSGGDIKTAVIKLYHHTPQAPLPFWCYALEYLVLVRGCLSCESLGWRSPQELMYGETVDISIFRFPWFSPVWYYNPRINFPEDKMCPGYFLGIAPHVGDSFSYLLITKDELSHYKRYPRTNPTTIVRSVVRKRLDVEDIDDAPTCTRELDTLVFCDKNGKLLEGNIHLIAAPSDTPRIMPLDSEEVAPIQAESVIPEQPNDDEVVSLSQQSAPYAWPDEEDQLFQPPDFEVMEPPMTQVQVEVDPMLTEGTHNIEELPNIQLSPQALTNQDELMEIFGTTPDNTNTPSKLPSRPAANIISQSQNDFTPDNISITSNAEEDNAHYVNNYFADEGDDRDEYRAITSHRWIDGALELEVEFSTGEHEFLTYDIVREEDPHSTATYIINNKLSVDPSCQRYYRWARRFLRDVKRTIRRLYKVNNDNFSPPDQLSPVPEERASKPSNVRKAHRASGKPKKPGRNNRQMGNVKYGVEVPRNWSDVERLDSKNNNRLWHDAVEKEMAALIQHECFEFLPPGSKIPKDYQEAPLCMVYEVKNDLRRKAHLVIQGFKVDPGGLSTRATVVKGLSVRLLDVIAHHHNLKTLAGDIGNAFIQARTKEKCYTICGPEFGAREGSITIIVRALYGLTMSAERWRSLFADFLRSIGFQSSRCDRDVWIRKRDNNKGYCYICTHVDDFKIISHDPEKWMTMVKQTFLVKSSGPPSYYLGNDYRWEDNEHQYTIGCKTYTLEAIRRIEAIFGPLSKKSTPLLTDSHPEMDDSPLLGEKDHRYYQMVMGMGQWLVTIGRPDLCFAVSSLSRFSASPRELHLELALRLFAYLKKYPDKCIGIDSTPIDFSKFMIAEELRPDFLREYTYAKEDMDPGFPEPYGTPLQTTILCDADHAHDHKTRRSITGILGYVGSTPVLWSSKRQGAIASSTYAAEFMALRTATEEAQCLRYMLRCYGIPIPSDGSMPTRIFGDNLGVIQNSVDVDADLKKKHVAISFHVVREAIAAGIIAPFWLQGEYNMSDIMTKQIPGPDFNGHTDNLFWTPKHRR